MSSSQEQRGTRNLQHPESSSHKPVGRKSHPGDVWFLFCKLFPPSAYCCISDGKEDEVIQRIEMILIIIYTVIFVLILYMGNLTTLQLVIILGLI